MPKRIGYWLTAGAALAALSACGSNSDKQGGPGGRGGTPTVGYVVVQPTSVPIVQDLPGRVAAFQISEVRPQVS
ncbi:MAG TPA: efflux transporter periplasmic adaptor subunit, partial [Sphingomicrobium sp.]